MPVHRRTRRPVTLRGFLARAARRVMVLWLALALSGLTLSYLPVNIHGVPEGTAESPRHP